jgi:hypothetical protein
MLVTCGGCDSKIKIPNTAAGKRVKCPKCATAIRVPTAESAPEEAVAAVPAAKPRPQPPPLKPSRGKSRDDDEEDDEDERPKKRRRREKDDEDDDDAGVPRRKKRKRRSISGLAVASMVLGIGSLILLITGPCVGSIFVSNYSIFFVPPIALVGAVVAIVLGNYGKKPGSMGFAYTGLVCSYIVVILVLVAVAFVAIHFVMPGPGGRKF